MYLNLASIPSKSVRRQVARLKFLSQPLRNKLARIAPRSDNDYATHIPILVGIAQRFTIRRVLELGCGAFSTSTFLNNEIFADLVQLDSYETDRTWLDRTAAAFATDERYRPRLVEGPISSSLDPVELAQFDLIFVDDSTSANERAETIRRVAALRPLKQLVVIHDYEISDYREATSDFEHRQIFRAFTPQTGVVWNGSELPIEILKSLNSQINKHSKNVAVEHVNGWKRVLKSE